MSGTQLSCVAVMLKLFKHNIAELASFITSFNGMCSPSILPLSPVHGTCQVALVVSLVDVTVWAVTILLATLTRGSAGASLGLLEGHVMRATLASTAFPVKDAEVCMVFHSP